MKPKLRNILAAVGGGGRSVSVLLLGAKTLRYCVHGRGHGAGSVLEFNLPDGAGWESPQQLGAAFGRHLRDQGLRVRRAELVLLPPDWTVLRTAQFPPATEAALLDGMVATAAEETFAERPESLAYAYQARRSDEGVAASIFACPRQQLERVQAFLAAAHLAARRVVPGGAAVAQSLGDGPAEVLIALADADDLTLLVSRDGRCTWQRSVPTGGDDGDARMQADLRRAALVAPVGDEAERTVVGNGRAAAAAEAILAPRADAGDAARQGVRTVPPEALVESLAAAQAALRRPALNLLADHTGQGRANLRRLLRVGAPAAVVLVALLTWFAISWISARSTIAATRARLDEIAGQLERAGHLRQLSRTVDPWFPENPGYLDALRALTLRFPQAGSIWVTGIEVSPAGEMTLTGQARQRSDVLALLAGLEADEHFTRVSRHFLRPQGGRQPVVAFSVSCRYRREVGP